MNVYFIRAAINTSTSIPRILAWFFNTSISVAGSVPGKEVVPEGHVDVSGMTSTVDGVISMDAALATSRMIELIVVLDSSFVLKIRF